VIELLKIEAHLSISPFIAVLYDNHYAPASKLGRP